MFDPDRNSTRRVWQAGNWAESEQMRGHEGLTRLNYDWMDSLSRLHAKNIPMINCISVDTGVSMRWEGH